MLPEHVVSDQFISRFQKHPLVILAPGRINLIGEHTDYNNGFVMPAAVDKYFAFAVKPNGTDQFNIFSVDYDSSASFRVDGLVPGNQWVNYLMGVVDGFRTRGVHLAGVDCVFSGNNPEGAGMSSSAALCCGFGFALNEIFQAGLSRLDLAHVAQRAEHLFAGVKCGIMDQYASLFGEQDSALLLDCRNLSHEYLRIDFGAYRILLIDTKVKHALGSTAYNQRRTACETGVLELQKVNPNVQSLRDVSLDELEKIRHQLPNDVFVKCRFVVSEIARTQQAAKVLKSGNMQAFGQLMYETHWGLSRDYEVSCEESDFLVNHAHQFSEDVLGARQMGGGFGGCVIHLIKESSIEKYSSQVRADYVAAFKKEPGFYLVSFTKGVHTL